MQTIRVAQSNRPERERQSTHKRKSTSLETGLTILHPAVTSGVLHSANPVYGRREVRSQSKVNRRVAVVRCRIRKHGLTIQKFGIIGA
jgi:hypothetical protein